MLLRLGCWGFRSGFGDQPRGRVVHAKPLLKLDVAASADPSHIPAGLGGVPILVGVTATPLADHLECVEPPRGDRDNLSGDHRKGVVLLALRIALLVRPPVDPALADFKGPDQPWMRRNHAGLDAPIPQAARPLQFEGVVVIDLPNPHHVVPNGVHFSDLEDLHRLGTGVVSTRPVIDPSVTGTPLGWGVDTGEGRRGRRWWSDLPPGARHEQKGGDAKGGRLQGGVDTITRGHHHAAIISKSRRMSSPICNRPQMTVRWGRDPALFEHCFVPFGIFVLDSADGNGLIDMSRYCSRRGGRALRKEHGISWSFLRRKKTGRSPTP